MTFVFSFCVDVCVLRVFKKLLNEESLNTLDKVIAKNSKICSHSRGMQCPSLTQYQAWNHLDILHTNIKTKVSTILKMLA